MIENEKKLDRRINKSKKAIEKALLELLLEKDFQEITVTDIVNKADVNRGTFYKHYFYKEDILKETQERIIEELQETIKFIYRGIDIYKFKNTSAQSIKIFDHVYKNRDFYHLVLNSNALPDFHKLFCGTISSIHVKEVLYDMDHPKINKQLFSFFQIYAVYGLIVEWDKSNYAYSSQYMAEQLYQILLFDHQNYSFKVSRNDSEK